MFFVTFLRFEFRIEVFFSISVMSRSLKKGPFVADFLIEKLENMSSANFFVFIFSFNKKFLSLNSNGNFYFYFNYEGFEMLTI